MSWTRRERITVIALVVVLLSLPISLQIGNVRAVQELDGQDQAPVTQTVSQSDYDGDTIPDRTDRCPTRPETQNGFQDLDGCPDTVRTVEAPKADHTPVNQTGGNAANTPKPTPSDYDTDGVVDAADRCPTRPESRNGYQDGDGCPDTVTTTGAS
ncbi:thrombospondin type 3 repeat-containing protein [Halobellus salinus]|nr:thrombospondin type 3 repeat-containing protein [Halobellus salinus]SMP32951.1 Thrombospondin type 3 repeat-containing protein [Halobellus salinus]